ncbi:MAG TPA: hypothetical protein VMR34_04820 [Candidatus Saccharimonadales bacterium]|nr:hypothetical protein [Candidatus Saccharimonadales bacterium]
MKKDHLEVLLEDIDGKMQALAEGMSLLQADSREIKKSVAHISKIEDDIKAIKAAVTDHNRVLDDHGVRITSLEHAA